MTSLVYPESIDLALPWANESRDKARQILDKTAVPSGSEEIWRYSRIDSLDFSQFKRGADSVAVPEPAAQLLKQLQVTNYAAINGTAADSKFVRELNDSDKEIFGSTNTGEFDELLNSANHGQVAVVDVPAGVQVEEPIVVASVGGSGSGAFPRMLIRAGANSQFTVIEHQVSEANSLIVPVVEIDVADGAHVEYITVQELPETSWLLSTVNSRVGRDATLNSFCASLGGHYARVVTNTDLVESGGTSKLNAAYFARRKQMHDFRTLQQHVGKKTMSDLLFKGAVDDFAESVYSGLIRIKKGAAGTNAFQTNRNLVLGENAHADSVPNLEIDENDVKCAHASAVGPIDEEQRYYLASRGIEPDVADRLIVMGFFGEMFERVSNAGLRGYLRDAVAAKWEAK